MGPAGMIESFLAWHDIADPVVLFSISVLDNADVDVKDILNHADLDILNRRGGHDGYV